MDKNPPSMISSVPVTKLDEFEANQMAPDTNSIGSPNRRIGV